MNIIIRFPDPESKRRALGKLAGRVSGKSWASGEVILPDAALAFLATEGFLSSSRDQPRMNASRRYEILLPLRFNDGQPVPEELVGDTLLELEKQFEAVS